MKSTLEGRLFGYGIGSGMIWGAGVCLLDKDWGIGATIAGVMIILFWLILPKEKVE